MLSAFRFPINLVKQEQNNPTLSSPDTKISAAERPGWGRGAVGGIFVGFLVTLIGGAAGRGACVGGQTTT